MPPSPKEITSEQAGKMIDRVSLRNREQVRARLAQLERSQEYQIVFVNSAACYAPTMPPNRIDYICPICGARTAYSREKAYYIANMPDMRKQIRDLNSLCSRIKSEFRFALDESLLCARCRKYQPAGNAVLVTTAGKTKPVRSVLRYPSDISLLISFFEGRQFDGGTQLRDEVKKIKNLIGW